MKRLFISFIIILCPLLFFLHSCSGHPASKFFMELKSAYDFDGESGTLIKYPSEMIFEPEEILIYSREGSKTQAAEYQTVSFSLEHHDSVTGALRNDYNIEIAYTVHNNKVVLASVPRQMPDYNYYTAGSSTDSVIISVGSENAYLINLNNASAAKLLNDDNFNTYFNRDSTKKLVFAQIMSVSPDGRYILYISNRDYMANSMENSYDLYCYDSQAGTERKVMDFNNKEIMTWDKNNPDSFLYRELEVSSEDGTRNYSPVYRYALESDRAYNFLNLSEIYRNYGMIDDEHIYIMVKDTITGDVHGVEETVQTALVYIANIYTREMNVLDFGLYTTVTDVKLSDTKEYLAFWGSYVNRNGISLTDLVTLHIETNDIVSQYEQAVEPYIIDSFYWFPDNILAVNFINMNEPFKDLCRFHKITHSFKLNAFQEAAAGITTRGLEEE